MQFTVETENNLIISDFKPEDCVDFLSMESISDIGAQFNYKQSNQIQVEPPPNSKDRQLDMLSPISPNFEVLKENEMLIPTRTEKQLVQLIQKKQMQPPKKKQSVSTKGSFMRYFHMRKFCNRILRSKYYFHKIQPFHLEILNDVASNYDPAIFSQKQFNFRPLGLMKNIQLPSSSTLQVLVTEKWKNVKAQLMKKVYYLNQQIPIIQPENNGRIVWDIVLSFTRLYFILLIPIDMVVEERLLYSDNLIIVTTLQTLLLIIDMLINLNTAYYEFGQIVSERSKIIRHNFSKGYGLDAFSIIYLIALLFVNWDYVGENEAYLFVGLLSFIIQYQNITRLTRIFEEVLNLNKIQAAFLELAKLITVLIYILHLAACIWLGVFVVIFLVWKNQPNSNRNKLVIEGGHAKPIVDCVIFKILLFLYSHNVYNWLRRYNTIMQSIILNLANLEHILCIIFIMIFSIQLPYSVNTVGAIIDKISTYSEQKLQKLRIINTYMNKKKITYELQVKIRQYLTYYWDCENTQISYEVKGILEQLTENLREQLMLEANSIILNGCDLFSKFFSPAFTKALVNKIRYLDVQPDNIVDFSDQPDSTMNCYLAFLENGKIDVIQDQDCCKNDTAIHQLQSGQVFGLYEFITNTSQTEFYKSKGFTKLLILPKNQFLKVLKEFPEDREKYCQIRDDLLYNNGERFLSEIGLYCYLCNSKNHICKNCPLIHFSPDRERIVKKGNYQIKQYREKHLRKQKRSQFCGLGDQKIIKKIAEYFKEDFWKECSLYDVQDNDIDQIYQQSPISASSDEKKDYIVSSQQFNSKPSSHYQHKIFKQSKMTRQQDLQFIKRAGSKNSVSPLLKYPTNQVISDQPKQTLVLPRTYSSVVEQQQDHDSLAVSPEKQDDVSSEKKNQTSKKSLQTGKIDSSSKPIQPKHQQGFNFIKRLKNLKIQIEKDTQIQLNSCQFHDLELQENQHNLVVRINHLKKHSEQEGVLSQLENLTRQINSQLTDEFQQLNNLDILKEFTHYSPHNNFTNLEMSNCYNKHLIENLSRYIKYLFYPFIYVKKYSKLDQEDVGKLERQRKTMSFSKRKATIVFKFRDKAKQIINSRRVIPE